ncbi:hypothetical protein [Bacillus sp. AFS017336]|uniref:hypothetical protein n=1 Tax=Bacillus sp. AFS017336 TaxID=2033489 RepID=UPI000BF1D0F7|nr:hypothetical protein [Bacillus sp. AFS017336]PEL14263.1 hypothetical protein CN601_01580 [Bacillus sp. AFS017336]
MKKVSKLVLIILLIVSTLIFSGCSNSKTNSHSNFSKEVLRKPIKEYLIENYGITENFKILSTTNDSVNGLDHNTFIELKKPYLAYINLIIERNSLDVIEGNDSASDNIYFELFKGAYIEQHPEVTDFSNHLINKFGLAKRSDEPYFHKKRNYYYYLNVNMNESQEQNLVEDFKKTRLIDTNKILPAIGLSKPRENIFHIGTINFNYQFDLNKNKNKVPKADELMEEYKNSKVLSEGIYGITIETINGDIWKEDELNSNVLFKVNASGEYSIIPTPKELQ